MNWKIVVVDQFPTDWYDFENLIVDYYVDDDDDYDEVDYDNDDLYYYSILIASVFV